MAHPTPRSPDSAAPIRPLRPAASTLAFDGRAFMSFQDRFRRLHRRLLARRLDKRTLHGVEVGVFVADDSTDAILNKLGRGIWLLQRYDPRQFGELKQHCRMIIIFGTTGPQAQWWNDVGWIWFNSAAFVRPHFTEQRVAATLVHEVAHARLDALGFKYTPDRRRRTEVICLRAQERFARRLPDSTDLATLYQRWAAETLQQSDSEWSDAAFHMKSIKRMMQLGLPHWLARLVARRPRTDAV